MIVIMERGASEEAVEAVIANLSTFGFDVHRSSGVNQTVLGAIGVRPSFDIRIIQVMDEVADVKRVTEIYKFASRSWKGASSIIDVGGVAVGGNDVVLIAGPSCVESEAQIHAAAAHVAAHQANCLRGGAFVPSSSPYGFRGLGEDGLHMLRQAAVAHGLKVVAEVPDVSQTDLVVRFADIMHVGAQNMQNSRLLEQLGGCGKPVMIERGQSATIDEWLLAAEHVMSHGNPDIIMCERGIRTFEPNTHHTLDLSAVPVLKEKSHLPVIVDPSRATGIRGKVVALARAAIAAGADGVSIDVHPEPNTAKVDGAQALSPRQFSELGHQLRDIARAIGRGIHPQLSHA